MPSNSAGRWSHVTWPEPDRLAWIAANRPGDDFEAPGPGARWTAGSRRNVEVAYGRYIAWLADNSTAEIEVVQDPLDLQRLKRFSDHLAETMAPITVWSTLQALARALAVMAPAADRSGLHKVLGRLKRRLSMSNRIDDNLVDPPRLIDVAVTMMDEAERMLRGKKAAVRYRNGAIIMAATLCPLRRQNWGGVLLGRHLQFQGETAELRFEANELKASSRPLHCSLPPACAQRLARYIDVYRPLLLAGSADSGALWLTWDGVPLNGHHLSGTVRQCLLKRCGKAFTFHMFRHAAATFIADRAPDQARLAAGVLQHADMRMTEAHYIRGQRTAAMRGYQVLVRAVIARDAPRGGDDD